MRRLIQMLELRKQRAYAPDCLEFEWGHSRPRGQKFGCERGFCIFRPSSPRWPEPLCIARCRGGFHSDSTDTTQAYCLTYCQQIRGGHHEKEATVNGFFPFLPTSQYNPNTEQAVLLKEGRHHLNPSLTVHLPLTHRAVLPNEGRLQPTTVLESGGTPMTPSLSAPTAQPPMSVPFHDSTLSLIDINGEPYVVMKAVIEGMGLSWTNYSKKLQSNKERWGMLKINIPSGCGIQKTLVMPLRKFTGWVQTINHNRVKNSLRHKILVFQREGDDCLWAYWSKGQSLNPRLDDRAKTPIAAQPTGATGAQPPTKTLSLAEWAGFQEEMNGLLKIKCQVLEGTFRKRKPANPVTNNERQQIATLRNQGLSLAEVARRIKRNPGTIRYHYVQVNPIDAEVANA